MKAIAALVIAVAISFGIIAEVCRLAGFSYWSNLTSTDPNTQILAMVILAFICLLLFMPIYAFLTRKQLRKG